MRSINCSMKRSMKRIKDQPEKDSLYALAHIDFFLNMDFFPEPETSVSQCDIARISRCQWEG